MSARSFPSLCWSPAFRRSLAPNRRKAGLQRMRNLYRNTTVTRRGHPSSVPLLWTRPPRSVCMRLTRILGLLFVAASIHAADKPDPSAEFFKMTGKVPVFQITIDKAEADSLRREPRKYVKCTVKVGDTTLKD